MRALLLAVAAALSLACSDPYVEYAPSGSASYQAATFCAGSSVADLFRAAADRWHEASPRVRITTRVVSNPEKPQQGCATNIYEASMGQCRAGEDGSAHCLAIGGLGLIALDPAWHESDDALDIMTHELGHVLLGAPYGGEDATHSTDSKSVMLWSSQVGEQDITARDVALLP